jgi:TPR repeat protein
MEIVMKLSHLLKQGVLPCAMLLVLNVQAVADTLSEANRAFESGNYAKAEQSFRQLAIQGNAEAQYTLGDMYFQGVGVPKNYQEAAKWHRLAAGQGIADAQNRLAVMYYKGLGVQKNYRESAKWFRLAAEQGDADAQDRLGFMYGAGKGLPQNYILSYMWESLSAANTTDDKQQKRVAEIRDIVASKMNSTQIAEAQELAKKCTANKFKGC